MARKASAPCGVRRRDDDGQRCATEHPVRIFYDMADATGARDRSGQPMDPLENNVSAFNADTAALGGYVYTATDRWSAHYATGRQTRQLIQMMQEFVDPSVSIADIGCGDGTFTLDIASQFRPRAIRGIDPAENAIVAAQQRLRSLPGAPVRFETGNIYDLTSEGESVAVIRGVLHHLDRVQAAIVHLATQFETILVLEPNGFNPVMKLIEKLSSYHRAHDEKSYWPPMLNGWFADEGFNVVTQEYCCLVPYFCPTAFAKLLARIEPDVEAVPLVRQVCCGTNLILYRRAR